MDCIIVLIKPSSIYRQIYFVTVLIIMLFPLLVAYMMSLLKSYLVLKLLGSNEMLTEPQVGLFFKFGPFK